jgi:hypothetical protein
MDVAGCACAILESAYIACWRPFLHAMRPMVGKPGFIKT